jgi:hypothetical protein
LEEWLADFDAFEDVFARAFCAGKAIQKRSFHEAKSFWIFLVVDRDWTHLSIDMGGRSEIDRGRAGEGKGYACSARD